MMSEQIVLEIDNTLDQLIQNAETISSVNLNSLSDIEMEAFQKTQESLLHHLLHLDDCLTKKPVLDKRSAIHCIAEKRVRFNQLKTRVNTSIANQMERRSFLSKRRKKRFLA